MPVGLCYIYHTHWSVDGPRIAPKVLTEHLDFKTFPGEACPRPPSLHHDIYGLTGFYLGAAALSYSVDYCCVDGRLYCSFVFNMATVKMAVLI